MNHRLSVLLCLLCPFAVHSQAPDVPTIRARTQIVVVDVSVTDHRGNAVHGLKASDFGVSEDGKPQVVQRFEEHVAASSAELPHLPAMPKLDAGVYTNYSPVPEDAPLNIILLDSLNTPTQDQAYARQQILKFLKTLKPGSHIAIFGLSTRLYLLQGFTSDPELLQAALLSPKSRLQSTSLLSAGGENASGADDIAEAYGNNPSMSQVTANLQQFEAEQAAQQDRIRGIYTLNALNQLARYLSSMPGRKNLVWFSGSFPIDVLPDGSLNDPFAAMESVADDFRETTDMLSQSQVAVYPVDARGLFNAPMLQAANSGAAYAKNPKALGSDLSAFNQKTIGEHSTMERMAEATGGKAFINTNDLTKAVDQAIDGGSNFYTLVYTPSNRVWDGAYRKIAVHLPQVDVTLAYRRGYYADDSEAPAHREKAPVSKTPLPHLDVMQAAMQRGSPGATQLLFKVRVERGPAEQEVVKGNSAAATATPPYHRYIVNYALNPSDIRFPQLADGSRQMALQFVTLVYDRDGAMVTSASYPIKSVLNADVFKKLIENGVQYTQEISVPDKGEYFLRIGVHDLIGNKIGAVEVPVASIPAVAVPTGTPAVPPR